MTPAIPLLPRHAMELDGPGWLNLFQVTVASLTNLTQHTILLFRVVTPRWFVLTQ